MDIVESISLNGLGLNLCVEHSSAPCSTSFRPLPRVPQNRSTTKHQRSLSTPAFDVLYPDPAARDNASAFSNLTLRSVKGMEGLARAETGASMVVLDAYGGGSGFKEGQKIAPGVVTPIAATTRRDHSRRHGRRASTSAASQMTRSSTLLGQYSTSARTAAELSSLLGNSRARVKPGATINPPSDPSRILKKSKSMPDLFDGLEPVTLEKGKSSARVELDILLESETGVEGGYLSGALEVRIRKATTSEGPVMLGGGKLRVIGFESIPTGERHVFYQCGSPLRTISDQAHVLYCSSPDSEGFCRARTGTHMVPFLLNLPKHISDGPKGVFSARSGIEIRYIVMASIKVRDPATNARSIAHFYRQVDIWPCLDSRTVLAPAPTMIQASNAQTLFLGGSGKLTLTAFLHRKVWLAGQRCYVKVAVLNDTKKMVKGVKLALIRVLTAFRPESELNATSPSTGREIADPDACLTSTTRKVVAESSLDAGERGSKGLVTAKGWWTGVPSGGVAEFLHFIIIPPEALSISRSRLIEVQYELRVEVNAGQLRSDLFVTLPCQIINFLSIDPPTAYFSASRFDSKGRNGFIKEPESIAVAESGLHSPAKSHASTTTTSEVDPLACFTRPAAPLSHRQTMHIALDSPRLRPGADMPRARSKSLYTSHWTDQSVGKGAIRGESSSQIPEQFSQGLDTDPGWRNSGPHLDHLAGVSGLPLVTGGALFNEQEQDTVHTRVRSRPDMRTPPRHARIPGAATTELQPTNSRKTVAASNVVDSREHMLHRAESRFVNWSPSRFTQAPTSISSAFTQRPPADLHPPPALGPAMPLDSSNNFFRHVATDTSDYDNGVDASSEHSFESSSKSEYSSSSILNSRPSTKPANSTVKVSAIPTTSRFAAVRPRTHDFEEHHGAQSYRDSVTRAR